MNSPEPAHPTTPKATTRNATGGIGSADASTTIDPLVAVRPLAHLLLIVAIALWGFTAWPLPWPGIATGIGATLAAVCLWAALLSPRAMFAGDVFSRALAELALIAAGTLGLLQLGAPVIIPVCLGAVAAASALIAGLRSL